MTGPAAAPFRAARGLDDEAGAVDEQAGLRGPALRDEPGRDRQDHHQPPEVRNAFRPQTVERAAGGVRRGARRPARSASSSSPGAGHEAFCSGGDQKVRGHGGYVGEDGVPRLNVLDLQRQIRTLPKPVIAMVAGYAIGGGHVLHLVCDLTIAAENARFGQTGPRVGSFDGGYGASYMARVIGQKRAREVWFLCRQYDAADGPRRGGSSTPSCPSSGWRRRPSPGAARSSPTARPRSACSRPRSTPTATARPGCSSSRATRRCSST